MLTLGPLTAMTEDGTRSIGTPRMRSRRGWPRAIGNEDLVWRTPLDKVSGRQPGSASRGVDRDQHLGYRAGYVVSDTRICSGARAFLRELQGLGSVVWALDREAMSASVFVLVTHLARPLTLGRRTCTGCAHLQE